MELYGPDVKLLCRLKRAQEDLNAFVLLSEGSVRPCPGFYASDVDRALQSSRKPLRLRIPPAFLDASLSRLLGLGLLEKPSSGPVYRVTYDGWFARRVRVREILRLIVTHVLFPSLVAFLTTLFTLWLAG